MVADCNCVVMVRQAHHPEHWFDRLTIPACRQARLSEVEGVMGLTVVLSVTQTQAGDGSIRAVTCLTTEDRQAGNIEYPPQGVLWRTRNVE